MSDSYQQSKQDPLFSSPPTETETWSIEDQTRVFNLQDIWAREVEKNALAECFNDFSS
jgi:hypothetical protein